MHARRLIVETNEHGQIVNLPPLSPGVRLEAIFLVLDEAPPLSNRQPPPDIAGKGRILGDIVSPVSDADDWEALR
jgi:hypothetical protein